MQKEAIIEINKACVQMRETSPPPETIQDSGQKRLSFGKHEKQHSIPTLDVR